MDHVVECKLSKVKLLGLDELLLELSYVSNQPDSSALVEVSRFVDPNAARAVIHELDFIGHHIQAIGLGQEGGELRRHFLVLLLQIQL